MSQLITATGTVAVDMAPLYLTCPRPILHALKKVALETDSNVHNVAIEAFTDYLHKNKDLVEKKVNLT